MRGLGKIATLMLYHAMGLALGMAFLLAAA